MLRRAWQRYCELLVTKPLITKAATGGTLFGLGDVLGQALDGSIERGQYDPARTLRAVVWSAAGFTPIAHAWYIKVLDRRVPGTTPKAVISKVALDQLLFAPFINAVYLWYANLSAGKDLDSAATAVRKSYPEVMKANYMLWPAVQLVNFKFVPPPLQIPVLNVAVLAWSTFLSLNAPSTAKQ